MASKTNGCGLQTEMQLAPITWRERTWICHPNITWLSECMHTRETKSCRRFWTSEDFRPWNKVCKNLYQVTFCHVPILADIPWILLWGLSTHWTWVSHDFMTRKAYLESSQPSSQTSTTMWMTRTTKSILHQLLLGTLVTNPRTISRLNIIQFQVQYNVGTFNLKCGHLRPCWQIQPRTWAYLNYHVDNFDFLCG